MKPIRWKQLLLCLVIPQAVGGLAGWLTRDAAVLFESLQKPPFAPPPLAFPIAWVILYGLMGISSYLILACDGPNVKPALAIYGAPIGCKLPLAPGILPGPGVFASVFYFGAAVWLGALDDPGVSAHPARCRQFAAPLCAMAHLCRLFKSGGVSIKPVSRHKKWPAPLLLAAKEQAGSIYK